MGKICASSPRQRLVWPEVVDGLARMGLVRVPAHLVPRCTKLPASGPRKRARSERGPHSSLESK
jgi:hypothetical protein